jgi:hypothetical protein
VSKQKVRPDGGVTVALRVPVEVVEVLEAEAKRQFRSLNGQIAFILTGWIDHNLKAKGRSE